MRNKSVNDIINSAFEITSKDDILMYCETYDADLTEEQYDILLNTANALNRIYYRWCKSDELHSLEDIGIAIKQAVS